MIHLLTTNTKYINSSKIKHFVSMIVSTFIKSHLVRPLLSYCIFISPFLNTPRDPRPAQACRQPSVDNPC